MKRYSEAWHWCYSIVICSLFLYYSTVFIVCRIIVLCVMLGLWIWLCKCRKIRRNVDRLVGTVGIDIKKNLGTLSKMPEL